MSESTNEPKGTSEEDAKVVDSGVEFGAEQTEAPTETPAETEQDATAPEVSQEAPAATENSEAEENPAEAEEPPASGPAESTPAESAKPTPAAVAPAATPATAAPAAPTTPAPAPAAPVAPLSDAEMAEAAKWGRVDTDGSVWLLKEDGTDDRVVGQFAAEGSEKDALTIYVRRYLDLEAQVGLLETRVENISPEDSRKSMKSLSEQLEEPAAIGDLDALRKRVDAVSTRIEERQAEVQAERAEAKKQAVANREAIVVAAEAIADQDPARTHWKNSREELSGLLDEWKNAQRTGVRIDRPTEEALWKRFSSARTKFDRHRRQHFSELDKQRKVTVEKKEELIKRAEAMQNSTDWGATSGAYRDLMNEWKASGRSNKKEDDRLWERFRAAQQVFFDARNAHNNQLDEEFGANLEQKLELLKEAEQLLPVKNVEAAKAEIRRIGERWDAIGRVPRADVQRTEGRMRDIEQAIRDAESEQWRDSDPELEERSSGMAAQLEALIAELEGQIEEARAAGDDKKVKEYEEALEARKAWLTAVQDD